MAEIDDLLTNDINNIARWPEGSMTVNQLNDAGRALEGILARWYQDLRAQTITSGSGTAYAVASNRSVTSYAEWAFALIRAHVANAGAATLAVSGLPAKPLRRHGGAQLVIGDIAANKVLLVAYNAAGDYIECIGIGDGALVAPSYTVAALPASVAGQIAYATNGRKNGEAGGAGTGVLVFRDGTAWRACDTGATVAA